MKKIAIIPMIIVMLITACQNEQAETGYFGQNFEVSSPIGPDEISNFLGAEKEKEAQVKGTIEKVCKASQCWLSMTDSEGKRFYFNVKDEAFKLPKNCEGKTAVVNGKLLSVSSQQERAREKGLKESYVESISNISMEASGFFIE